MNALSPEVGVADPPRCPVPARAATLPLVAGARVTTLRGITGGQGAAGLGRIGGFAVRAEQRQWTRPVLVTNCHVLRAHRASAGDPVFRPAIDDGPVLRLDRRRLDPVAAIEDMGQDGPHRFTYPGEPAAEFHIDCAAARVSRADTRPAGPVAFARVARAHALDVLPNRVLTARLLGVHGRPAGRITDVAATVERADGRLCRNTIVIETLPGRPRFAAVGDSGALVVDGFGRAVGLLWGIHLDRPTIAFACHIHPVLDRLGLVLSRRAWLDRRSPEGA